MKNLIVSVKLWNKEVGSLAWDTKNEVAIFEYEDKFLKSEVEIAPIIMPSKNAKGNPFSFLQNKNNCFKGLPGIFADSLPDKFGTQIITEWYAMKGLSSDISPLDNLCYVGKRGMGALEFEPSDTFEREDASSLVNIGELSELSRKVLNDRNEFRASLENAQGSILDILKIGTSAGGAKPKAIIAFNPITKEVRSGQVKAPEGFGYYLLKFDGVEDVHVSDNPSGVGNIEYAYYKMALDCKINMMHSELFREGEHSHFMTTRFDRTLDGEKLHIQTLAAIAHLNRDIPCSYEQGFGVIRKLNLPYLETEEFYRRMVFNVMSRNHDDHTKNHSFMMNKDGMWSLAPAYDLCYSYSSTGQWTAQHQMSLNGKRSNFDYSDLVSVAKTMEIKDYDNIIGNIADVISKWKVYALEAGVKNEHLKNIQNNLLILKKNKIQEWGLGM